MTIYNPRAYELAIKANILANARTTFCRTVEDHQQILDWLDKHGSFDLSRKPATFAESLWDAFHKYGKLTEGQCEAVRKAIVREAEWNATKKAEWIAKRAEERANAEDVPEGRVDITGVIVGEKIVDSDFGRVRKITVKDDRGFVVYGTIPSKIEEAIINNFYETTYDNDKDALPVFVGVRLQFTATLTASKDDSKFGFYKRPTKPSLLDGGLL